MPLTGNGGPAAKRLQLALRGRPSLWPRLDEVAALRADIARLREALEASHPSVSTVGQALSGEATLSAGQGAFTGIAQLRGEGTLRAAGKVASAVGRSFRLSWHQRTRRRRATFAIW
jgi:hypothetical protein